VDGFLVTHDLRLSHLRRQSLYRRYGYGQPSSLPFASDVQRSSLTWQISQRNSQRGHGDGEMDRKKKPDATLRPLSLSLSTACLIDL
jgi:hypothetical protein